MQDQTAQQQTPQQEVQPQDHAIVDQTLGELLQNNPQAQQMIMKAMGISQEKFQEMLSAAKDNELMHMKIEDLFKSGIVQKAVEQHDYVHQGDNAAPTNDATASQPAAPSDSVQGMPAAGQPAQEAPKKKSFLKSLFGL